MLRKKNWLKSINWCLGLILGLSLFGVSLMAQAETSNFSVRPELPKNQVDRDLGYFDLKVAPKQTQTLSIILVNADKVAHQYDIATNLATTGDNGTIVYSNADPEIDPSLQFNIANAVTGPKTVTVPAQRSKKVTLKLTVPEKRFYGVVLGGINVQQRLATPKKGQAGVSVRNRFSYVIGLQLREQAKPTIKPELKLLGAGSHKVGYQTYISAHLQNPQAVVMSNLKIESYVTKVGSSKQQLKTTKSQFKVAPNSRFYFNLGDGSQRLTPGKYQLHLQVKAADGTGQWRFTKAFTVKSTQTKSSEQSTTTTALPDKPVKQTNWGLIGGLIAVIVVLVGLIIWVLSRNRHRRRH